MDTVLICCETIRDEMELALTKAGYTLKPVWIESGLHNVPEKLRARLQEELSALSGVERVLLGFGFCGNALAGLHTGNFELIVPRVDDCISLLLGSVKRRLEIKRTYFFTPGWVRGERSIWDDYLHTIEKYGPKRGEKIFGMILGNYETLGLLDTGAYDLPTFVKETEHIAQGLGLQQAVLGASVEYLEELLHGPWPAERFLRIPPGTEIQPQDLTV